MIESRNENTTNINEINWFDDNPFFCHKEEYEDFLNRVLTATVEGDLPILLECEQPEKYTVKDLTQFSMKFWEDTHLSIRYEINICEQCNRPHCFMVIEELSDDSD